MLLLLSGGLRAAPDFDLPDLGDTTSGIISPRQEFELGRAWLGMFRSQVRTLDDPELQVYLENLLTDLAEHSELNDRRLELVLINNPTLNAFAVPGGVVGVHTGLFRYTESEDQLASVLSHELAHLSQRHFARSLERRKTSTIGTMAGMLAGVLLAATVGGDAGLAAMTMSQAAAIESSLRYSRQNEQEADRIGIQTLFESGRDPAAVGDMFERMLASTRFTGRRPPEFLLTHPLTERRVADTRNRINNYPTRQYPVRPDYEYMRVRAMLWLDGSPNRAAKRFRNELEGFTNSRTASAYGLALALSRQGEDAEALETLRPLLKKEPKNFRLRLAEVELETNRGNFNKALDLISALEPLHGSNYAVRRYKAEIHQKKNEYQQSEAVLEALSRDRPSDPKVWFHLAEVSGLAGDISGVHRARAEYFILIGAYDDARDQLLYAQRLAKQDYRLNAIIEARLAELETLVKRAEQL
jgi:beta-barrel assembly-enhancing protease